MAYKPPKAYSDHAGRSMVEKQIKGVRHRKCLGRAGTPEARAAYEQFKPVSYTHLTLPTIYSV